MFQNYRSHVLPGIPPPPFLYQILLSSLPSVPLPISPWGKLTERTTFPSACFAILLASSSSSSSTSLVTNTKVSQPLPSFKSSTSFWIRWGQRRFLSYLGLLLFFFFFSLLHSPGLFSSRQTRFISLIKKKNQNKQTPKKPNQKSTTPFLS